MNPLVQGLIPDINTRISTLSSFLKSCEINNIGEHLSAVHVTEREPIATLVPCMSPMTKHPIVFVYDESNDRVSLLSVMMNHRFLAQRFTDDPNVDVDVIELLFQHAFTRYTLLAWGFDGMRMTYNTEGFFSFGIGAVVIGRIWVNTYPRRIGTQLRYRNDIYAIDEFNPSIRWVAENSIDPEFVNRGSYYTLLMGLIPTLHARRMEHDMRYNARINDETGYRVTMR